MAQIFLQPNPFTIPQEPPPDPEETPFDRALKQQASERRQGSESALRQSASQVAGQNPDHAAKVIELSRTLALPADFVERNFDSIQKQAEINNPQFQRIVRTAPKTAAFLAEPANAAVAQDDHPTLTSWEQMLTYGGQFLKAARAALPQFNVGFYGRLQETGEILGKYIAPPTGPFAQGAPFKWLAEQASIRRQQSEAWAAQLMPKTTTQRELDIAAAGASTGQNLLLMPFAALGGIAGGAELASKAFLGAMAIAGGGDYAQARAQGMSVEKAALYDAVQTASEYFTELIPANKLFASWEKAGGLRMLSSQLLHQGWTEELNTVVKDLAAWAYLPENQTKTFGDYLRERPSAAASTAVQTLVSTAALVGTMQLAHKAVSSMGAIAKESPLVERSPDKAREHIQAAAEGTGLENVYIHPEDIRERAAAINVNPAALAETMTEGGAAKLAEAIRTGEDIEIPVADYVTRVGPSEHAAFFDQVMRPGSPLAANEREVAAIAEEAMVELTPEEIQQQETIQENLTRLNAPELGPAIAQALETMPEAPPPIEAAIEQAPSPEVGQAVEDALTIPPAPAETYFDRIEREAKQRIRERGTLTGERLGAGLPIEDIADVVIIGAAKIARGVGNFAAWSSEMVAEYGERITPYLRDLYVRSLREAGERLKVAPEAIQEGAASMMAHASMAAAETHAQLPPFFTTAEMAGMTEEEFAKYKGDLAEAGQKGRAQLQAEIVERLTRLESASRKEVREKVRLEAQTAIYEQPEYIAISVLQKGVMPDGSALPENVEAFKLDQAALEEQYGKHADSPEMQALRKIDAYRKEGGVSPDEAAALIGYSSGDEMVQAIMAAPPVDEAIEVETDRRMLEQYGANLDLGAIEEKARDLAMTTGRVEILHKELKTLAKRVRETAPFVELGERRQKATERTARQAGAEEIRAFALTAKQARLQAEAWIEGKRVRDITPGLYSQAARRASAEAIEAVNRGDFPAAITAGNKELLNLERYRAAREAQTESIRIARNMKSYDAPAKRERIGKAGFSYLDQIDALRERYDFATITLKQIDRRKSLVDWVAEEQAEGRPTSIPPEMLNEAKRKNYRDMTLQELRALDDAVENIAHLAGLKNKLIASNRKRELDAAADEITTSIADHSNGPRPVELEPRLPSGERSRKFERYMASHEKLPLILRMMDGFEDGGVMWEYVMSRLNEAADAETAMNREATTALNELFAKAFRGEESALWRKTFIPALNASLTKWARIMVALNSGNEENASRLRSDPVRKWTDAQIRAILDTLDERDWKYVQAVLDHIETYWPQIAAKEKRVSGVAPEKVVATPMVTRYGTFRGGYFPIYYEDRLFAGAANNLDASFSDSIKQASYAQATTRRGHTEARLKAVSQPLRLDHGVIVDHLQQVIHDLTHHEALIDIGRLLSDKRVQESIYTHYGDQTYKEIRAAVRDIALGNGPAPEWYKSIDGLRQGVVVSSLAWKFMTAFLQPLQLTNSVVRLGGGAEGAKWVAKGIARWMRSAKNADGSVGWIKERSTFMRDRWMTQNRELNEIRNQVGLYSGKISGWMHDQMVKLHISPESMPAVADSYFYMIQRLQQIADVPTWNGAFLKAMAAGEKEERAARLADQVVIDAQGSGHIKDLSRIERQQGAKLLTTFYSFQNLLLQNAIEALKRDVTYGRKIVDASLVTWIPIVLTVGLFRIMRPGDDDEETFMSRVFQETIGQFFGMFVGLRELQGIAQGRWDYKGPASLRFIPDIYAAAYQIKQGEADAAFWKAVNRAGGDLFHYPADQIAVVVPNIQALWDGTIDPFEAVGGILGGRAPKKK